MWSDYDGSYLYPHIRTTDCAPIFEYEGNTYKNCTIDGDNGDIPWCSLTKDYLGYIVYCIDYENIALNCTFPFTMPGGKVYNSCAILSASSMYKQCKTNDPVYKYIYCTDALQNHTQHVLTWNPNCDPTYKNLTPNHTMW
jgi:hypothetical protein